MGGFLSQPKTAKETHAGEGAGLKYALSSMQGWRVEMEDAHIATTDIGHLKEHGYFAVFDGHGGKTVSTRAGAEFIKYLNDTELMKDQQDMTAEQIRDLLYQTNFDFDDYLRATDSELASGDDRSGSTAVACMVSPTHFIISNCGDSRAIVCSNGEVKFATTDHKPTDPEETRRIENAKGSVSMGRVNGNLAVSRALGDFIFKDTPELPAKDQKVCCEPDMTIIERSDKDELLVLACDGIWDVMSNEAVYEFCTNQIKAGYTLTETCNRLIDYCLGKDSRDNMSVIIVALPNAPVKKDGFVAPETVPVYGEEAEQEASGNKNRGGHSDGGDGDGDGEGEGDSDLASLESGNPEALLALLTRLGLNIHASEDDPGKLTLVTDEEAGIDNDDDDGDDDDDDADADGEGDNDNDNDAGDDAGEGTSEGTEGENDN